MPESEAFELKVDTLGFLANNLRGYEPGAILREQLQNADDACLKQDRTGDLCLQFLPDRLAVTNPSIFNDEDWARLERPSCRGKSGDADQIGEFGVGFWGALHITDEPTVTSGHRRETLNPLAPTQQTVAHYDGTKVEFVYRLKPTDLGDQLKVGPVTKKVIDSMAAAFVAQMAELLLFTRAIEVIEIELPSGSRRVARRRVEPLEGSVERLTVSVDGASEENCRYLLVRSELADPPPGRHGRVTAALPLTKPHRGPGRAFFMFPTETESGLNLSVDAHFQATNDRRSLEKEGDHGAWNEKIFEQAGKAVGESLETVLNPTIHGLDTEDAISWFETAQSARSDVARRTKLFVDQLDSRARGLAVIPDREGCLRRGGDLVSLAPEIEPLLAEWVGNTAKPTIRQTTANVYGRWGLRTWGPSDVADWLKKQLPTRPIARKDAPAFVNELSDALKLLDYCRDQQFSLEGVALLLGTDDSYHPIGGRLARPSEEHMHLVAGLSRPVVNREFRDSWAGKKAPRSSPEWLREALVESVEKLVGRRVPVKAVGAAKSYARISEAINIVDRTVAGLDGVPLAPDEHGILGVFDDKTVGGLPAANRQQAEHLVRRLGLRPLHKSIEDKSVSRAARRFSVSLINELGPFVADWDPVSDSRLLVKVLAAMQQESSISPALVEQLRSWRIWQGSDGETYRLDELLLAARDRVSHSGRILVSKDLVGALDPAEPVYATLRGLLRVDVFDTTEETVLECENPPADKAEQRQLLLDLAYCENLSQAQIERLQRQAFVLGQDGQLRTPSDTFLTLDQLPLGLGDRCVDAEVKNDRRLRVLLAELGAPELPQPAELLDVATEIAESPVDADPAQDPSRVLWDHLFWSYKRYPLQALGALADIPWLLISPGPAREKPRKCYDPKLSFAGGLFPVPLGVASPPQALREALRIRVVLETDDCVKLAKDAASKERSLDSGFFGYINRRCKEGSSDERSLAKLRELPILPLGTGLTKPSALVSSNRARIWGHLRAVVPAEFVTDYQNLLRAWRVTKGNDEVNLFEHIDVLGELSGRSGFDSRDKALALARIASIAALDLNDQQVENMRRTGFLVTSSGLSAVSDAFRIDLPPAVVDKLKPLLPIVEESNQSAELLNRLKIRGLRSALTLEAVTEGNTADSRWSDVLERQAPNVLRFLKSSRMRIDQVLLEAWPPSVYSVAVMTVRVSMNGQVRLEWEAKAHLEQQNEKLALYVSGDNPDGRAVVDAITSEFGVDRGLKSLLLNVLAASTREDGADLLDWENIPALTDDESSYIHHYEEMVAAIPAPVKENEPAPRPEAVGDNGQVDDISLARRRSRRGTTDVAALEERGIVFDGCSAPESVEEDNRTSLGNGEAPSPRDEIRVCLSFFDVSKGLIPVGARDLKWLAAGEPLEQVEIFGQKVAAHRAGKYHIELEDGAILFYQRLVVPGTVMRVRPLGLGQVEVEVRPDRHKIDGVWMLELDDSGGLTRLKQDNIELEWETDDLFYKAERRLEDIEALMSDGGKSALQLIIEVFLARPSEGLSVEKVWGLVAISRLFAKATIGQTLAEQKDLFESRKGLWYKIGDKVRQPPPPRPSRPEAATSSRLEDAAVLDLAKELENLLADADPRLRSKVFQILGVSDPRVGNAAA